MVGEPKNQFSLNRGAFSTTAPQKSKFLSIGFSKGPQKYFDLSITVEVKRAAKGDDWLCLGTKKMIPELSTIQGITSDLNALAKSLQGVYDGWEAKVEK